MAHGSIRGSRTNAANRPHAAKPYARTGALARMPNGVAKPKPGHWPRHHICHSRTMAFRLRLRLRLQEIHHRTMNQESTRTDDARVIGFPFKAPARTNQD